MTTVLLKEQAAANSNKTNYSQIWVQNSTPQLIKYTTDGGTTHTLTDITSIFSTYEYGTFTPDVTDTDYSASKTIAIMEGYYWRYGNFVWCNVRFSLSSLGTLSGSWRIVGLPFPLVEGWRQGGTGGRAAGSNNLFASRCYVSGVAEPDWNVDNAYQARPTAQDSAGASYNQASWADIGTSDITSWHFGYFTS